MLIGKLSNGVLRVLTPLGPRFVRPTLSQRLYLLWTFRHFELLPLQVLNTRQRQLIDDFCRHRRRSPIGNCGTPPSSRDGKPSRQARQRTCRGSNSRSQAEILKFPRNTPRRVLCRPERSRCILCSTRYRQLLAQPNCNEMNRPSRS